MFFSGALDGQRLQILRSALARFEAGEDPRASDFALLREAALAGYFVVWRLFDDGDLEGGDVFLRQLEALVDRYAQPTLPPALHYARARLHWVRRAYFFSVRTLPADRLETERNNALNAALRLTDNLDLYPPDRNELRLMRAHILATRLYSDTASWDEACRLAVETYVSGNFDRALRRIVDCAVWKAHTAATPGAAATAQVLLGFVRNEVGLWRQRNEHPEHQAMALNQIVRLNQAEATLAGGLLQQPLDDARWRIRAMDAFIAALESNIHDQEGGSALWDLYSGLGEPNLEILSGSSQPTQQWHVAIRRFERLRSALEPARRQFPRDSWFAAIGSDVSSQLANWYFKTEDFARAAVAGGRSVEAADIARFVGASTEYNGNPEYECRARANYVVALSGANQTDQALASFGNLAQICGGWLRRFPWDYYVRASLNRAAAQLGKHLHQRHRYADALPLLQYSSDWGNRDSTIYLADIYRFGRGVPLDTARADRLARLATSQSMKRFTVPTNFNGVNFPFHVYITQYASGERCPIQAAPLPDNSTCIGFDGIDDQVEWVSRARRGAVPQDVITSFRRLDQIARENNVSLPDLAVYALGAAQGERARPAGGTPGSSPSDRASGGNASAGAAPPGAATPAPLTTVGPSRFYAEDRRGPQPALTETFVLPLRPSGSCFVWRIPVTRNTGPVELVEELIEPAAPANWDVDPARTTISPDGRRATTRIAESAEDGLLTHGWCLGEGNSLGLYQIRVLHEGRLLYDVSFQVLPASEFPDPAQPQQRPQTSTSRPVTTIQQRPQSGASPSVRNPDNRRQVETGPVTTPEEVPPSTSGPAGLDPSVLAERAVILLQGRDTQGRPIYTYLQLTLGRLRDLRDVMRRGEDFKPRDYGTVLAEGPGEPSEEVRARMARDHNMTDLPRAASPPSPGEARPPDTGQAVTPPDQVSAARPNEPPSVLGAEFFAEERGGQRTVLTLTTTIPFRPNSMCFRWRINITPVQASFVLREEFELPAAPTQWSGLTAANVLAPDGRHLTSRLEDSGADGNLSNAWCIAEGDPVGPHRIRVFYQDVLLHDFRFDVVR